MDHHALKVFILEAKRATHAAGDRATQVKEFDGSISLWYEKGSFKYHDNYFGGEPYGGREVVWLRGKPIWMMTYYGSVSENFSDVKNLYAFLRDTLLRGRVEEPYRGPSQYEKDSWIYTNNVTGNIRCFSGVEKISKDNIFIYEASYMGGFINIRKG